MWYNRGMKTSILTRFEAKINKTESCWLWTAAINSDNGYGRFDGRKYGLSSYAHRVSWEIYRGPIPEGSQVLHRCDIRSCVNPEHLFLGSQQDNIDDMVNKERAWFSKKDKCPKGHEYDITDNRGKRKCRTCTLAYQRAWYAKNGKKKEGG